MAGLAGVELQLRSYDPTRYPFRQALTRAAYERYMPGDWESDQPPMQLDELHNLHRWLGGVGVESTNMDTVHTRQTDQIAQHYDDLYTFALHPLRPAFKLHYLDFLLHEVLPLFNEQIVYQTVPTLRVHMPGNVAVGEYHTDANYGHPPEAVNFWLPATDAEGTRALYIQTSQDAQPLPRPVKYGQYLIFDGVALPHGNEINTTGKTRVSFDFRVVPVSQFKPSDKRSINTGLAFTTGDGGYYSLLDPHGAAQQRAAMLEVARPALEWEARQRTRWQ